MNILLIFTETNVNHVLFNAMSFHFVTEGLTSLNLRDRIYLFTIKDVGSKSNHIRTFGDVIVELKSQFFNILSG